MWELITVLASIVALGASFLAIWKTNTLGEMTQKYLEEEVYALRNHIDGELEPLITKVNRAFGMRSEQAATARQLKTAEKYIAQDLIDQQNPLLKAGLELLSPRTLEYFEKNPDLIVQLIPRLQALSSIEGFQPTDLLGQSNRGNRKHPFGFREE